MCDFLCSDDASSTTENGARSLLMTDLEVQSIRYPWVRRMPGGNEVCAQFLFLFLFLFDPTAHSNIRELDSSYFDQALNSGRSENSGVSKNFSDIGTTPRIDGGGFGVATPRCVD